MLLAEDNPLLLMQPATILGDAGAAIASACGTVEQGLVAAENDDISAAALDVKA